MQEQEEEEEEQQQQQQQQQHIELLGSGGSTLEQGNVQLHASFWFWALYPHFGMMQQQIITTNNITLLCQSKCLMGIRNLMMCDKIFMFESFINIYLIGMGSLEDHKAFGALHSQFWWLEPPLVLGE